MRAIPPTMAAAPIMTQIRLPVMKLSETITFSPWRIQIAPAAAIRAPTIVMGTGRTPGW